MAVLDLEIGVWRGPRRSKSGSGGSKSGSGRSKSGSREVDLGVLGGPAGTSVRDLARVGRGRYQAEFRGRPLGGGGCYPPGQPTQLSARPGYTSSPAATADLMVSRRLGTRPQRLADSVKRVISGPATYHNAQWAISGPRRGGSKLPPTSPTWSFVADLRASRRQGPWF